MGTRAAAVFAGMDGDRLDRVLRVLGEGSGTGPMRDGRIADLQRMGLTEGQARDAAGLFCELSMGALNPALMERVIGGMDASDGEKGLLLGVFRKIVGIREGSDAAAPAGGAGAAYEPQIAARAGARAPPAFPLPLPSPRNAANANAFDAFVERHADDPEFKDRYVAFVHGRYQKAGDSRESLEQEMYDKFGYVKMYVGQVTKTPRPLFVGGMGTA